jgi:putative spermidine/putrescine transport system substrate-binding protein
MRHGSMRHGRGRLAALAAIAAAAATLLTACGGASSSGGGTAAAGGVEFTAFGGSGQQAEASAWLTPFAKSTGITVTQDSPTDYAKVQQMTKSGHGIWDIVEGGADYGLSGNATLASIDCKVVDCSAFTGSFKVYPQGVPLFVFSYTLAYNTTTYKTSPPTSFADLFNTKKFPGKRDVDGADNLVGLIEAALIADGVPRDKLYPLDLNRAFRKLDTIRSSLVFYQDAQQCISDVAAGNAVMGMCYNGRVTLAQQQGEPIAQTWGQQIQFCDYLFIPKDAPDPANAQKLIAYITSAAHNGDISNYIAYSPANPGANPNGKYAADVPTKHEEAGANAPIVPDLVWWSQHQPGLDEKISAWLSS